MNAITLNDINVSINTTQPRIQDLKLAEALGFSKTLNIRKLISRYTEILEKFGKLFFRTVRENTRGRPGTEYWLNEKQALYLCTKSEAQNAIDITIQMVEVFYAVKTGRHQPRPDISPDCMVVSRSEWEQLQNIRAHWKRLVVDIEKQTIQLRKTVMREGFGFPVSGQPALPCPPNRKRYGGRVDALPHRKARITRNREKQSTPRWVSGPVLYNWFRHWLREHNTSLTRFCEEHNLPRSTVSEAMRGTTKGPVTRRTRRQIKRLVAQ